VPLSVCGSADERSSLNPRGSGGSSRILGRVTDGSTPKSWVVRLPASPPMKDSPEQLVAAAGGSDAPSNPYCEFEVDRANDPTFVRQEAAQRRFPEQYLRRLRRLGQREKHRQTD
jgi:hypothetical protein